MDRASEWLPVRSGIHKPTQIIEHMGLNAYLPASFSFKDDRLIVHGNLGWNRDSADRVSHLQWG
jgi:hypothetical protein